MPSLSQIEWSLSRHLVRSKHTNFDDNKNIFPVVSINHWWFCYFLRKQQQEISFCTMNTVSCSIAMLIMLLHILSSVETTVGCYIIDCPLAGKRSEPDVGTIQSRHPLTERDVRSTSYNWTSTVLACDLSCAVLSDWDSAAAYVANCYSSQSFFFSPFVEFLNRVIIHNLIALISERSAW